MVKGGFPQSSESCPQKQSPTPPTHKNILVLLNVSCRYTSGCESDKGKIDTVEGCSWYMGFLEMAGGVQELELVSKLSRALLFKKKKERKRKEGREKGEKERKKERKKGRKEREKGERKKGRERKGGREGERKERRKEGRKRKKERKKEKEKVLSKWVLSHIESEEYKLGGGGNDTNE